MEGGGGGGGRRSLMLWQVWVDASGWHTLPLPLIPPLMAGVHFMWPEVSQCIHFDNRPVKFTAGENIHLNSH